jgi:hypothetical protein
VRVFRACVESRRLRGHPCGGGVTCDLRVCRQVTRKDGRPGEGLVGLPTDEQAMAAIAELIELEKKVSAMGGPKRGGEDDDHICALVKE